MLRATAREQRNAPARFVSSTSFHCSSLMRTNNPSRVRPALLTRMSTRPSCFTASSNAASTEAALRDVGTVGAWPGRRPFESPRPPPRPGSRCGRRWPPTRRARASARETASPMPVAPPVTNATCCSSSRARAVRRLHVRLGHALLPAPASAVRVAVQAVRVLDVPARGVGLDRAQQPAQHLAGAQLDEALDALRQQLRAWTPPSARWTSSCSSSASRISAAFCTGFAQALLITGQRASRNVTPASASDRPLRGQTASTASGTRRSPRA